MAIVQSVGDEVRRRCWSVCRRSLYRWRRRARALLDDCLRVGQFIDVRAFKDVIAQTGILHDERNLTILTLRGELGHRIRVVRFLLVLMNDRFYGKPFRHRLLILLARDFILALSLRGGTAKLVVTKQIWPHLQYFFTRPICNSYFLARFSVRFVGSCWST